MNHFAFILGRETKLSLAELIQVFHAHELQAQLISFSEEMAVFSSERDLAEIFPLLGGSIKVAEVREAHLNDIAAKMQDLLKPSGKEKFYFGASVYKADDAVSSTSHKQLSEMVRKQLFAIRKGLKEAGISLRVVESKEDHLSSVVVRKNKLITDQGAEVIIGQAADKVWIGKTMNVQDFEEFASRDFARPFRDDRSGMLPPKLARIMVNLSGKAMNEKVVVLDPFCGSGTVLQEAALLGAGKVLGSDISERAVEDSLRNLEWLKEQGHAFNSTVEQVDVAEVDGWLPKDFVDVIVTEPYLGEPVRTKLSPGQVNDRQQGLSDLYEKALIAMQVVLKKDGVLVMIFPFIGTRRVPLPRSMKKHWEVIALPKELISSERGGVDYKRENQHVGREILVLKKR